MNRIPTLPVTRETKLQTLVPGINNPILPFWLLAPGTTSQCLAGSACFCSGCADFRFVLEILMLGINLDAEQRPQVR